MTNGKMYMIILVISFILTLVITKKLISVMTKKKIGQSILEIGPSWHKAKEGTPTMGGIAFLLASLCTFLVAVTFFTDDIEKTDLSLIINVLLYGILNGLVGLIDDISKYRKRKNEGLTPLEKLIFQFILAALFLFSVSRSTGISTVIKIPVFDTEVDFGFFYYVIAFFMLSGITNAVNLTDGLDGLATTSVLPISVMFSVCGLLLFPNGVFDFIGALLTGICLAFLIFNIHPAKIFMGDTGSLFLGSTIVALGVATNNVFPILIYSFVFLCEALSVMMQVTYFKITHGKRIFKMAPIHHHLEKCGYSEMKIVSIFGIVSTIFCVGAFFLII